MGAEDPTTCKATLGVPPSEQARVELSTLLEQLPQAHAEQLLALSQTWGIYSFPGQEPQRAPARDPKQLCSRVLNLRRKLDRKKQQGRKFQEELQQLVDRAIVLYQAIDDND